MNDFIHVDRCLHPRKGRKIDFAEFLIVSCGYCAAVRAGNFTSPRDTFSRNEGRSVVQVACAQSPI